MDTVTADVTVERIASAVVADGPVAAAPHPAPAQKALTATTLHNRVPKAERFINFPK